MENFKEFIEINRQYKEYKNLLIEFIAENKLLFEKIDSNIYYCLNYDNNIIDIITTDDTITITVLCYDDYEYYTENIELPVIYFTDFEKVKSEYQEYLRLKQKFEPKN